MVDLKISKSLDPTPCMAEDVVNCFKNTETIVHTRADYNDAQLIDRILSANMKTVLIMDFDDDPGVREHRYYDIKKRWEELHK